MQKMRPNVRNDTMFRIFFWHDQIVVAKGEEDISYMAKKPKEEYALTMNLSKCEYLIVGNEKLMI